MSAEAEKQIQGIYDAIYKGVPEYGQGAILGVTNQANYSLAGVGDKSIRHYIRDQDRATRRVIIEAVEKACEGGDGGPLAVTPADRLAIAEAVANELASRMRS